MPESTISVVPIGPKLCKPFLLEVMVFSPESGFKFEVLVERACTVNADPVWKLVFDLYKLIDGQQVQVVHVSYTAKTPVESKAVQAMAAEGVKPVQATVLTQEVFPAAKQVVGKKKATKKQTEALLGSISHALTIEG
jgi:hypothetical protein